MKESAPLDGSEGIAGAGGGQGQVADKKNDSSGLTLTRPCKRPREGLSIVFIPQVRKLVFRESRQGCGG